MARVFERPKKFVARAGKDVRRAAVDAKDIVGDKAEVFVEKAGEGAVVIADKAGDAKLAFDKARFHLDKNGVLYYRDPYDDHLYINLEDYFGYLNEVRVNELKNVAHALGAKHVMIEYKMD